LGEQLSNANEPSQAALERAGQDTYDVIAHAAGFNAAASHCL